MGGELSLAGWLVCEGMADGLSAQQVVQAFWLAGHLEALDTAAPAPGFMLMK